MLANSLADVVAEEAAKRLRLNVLESGSPNVWRWYKQTYGQNVVQQATFYELEPLSTRSAIEKVVDELAQ